MVNFYIEYVYDFKTCVESLILYKVNAPCNLLLNLRSPRDCGSCRSRLWYFISLLDGASVREAHCAQASTEAPCAQASTAVREAHRAQATGRPV